MAAQFPKSSSRFMIQAGLIGLVAALAACQGASPPATPGASPSPSAAASATPSASPGTTPVSPAPSVAPGSVAASLGMKFVTIQPGSFSMGDAKDGPVHQVTLSKGFELQSTEVTQAQWKAIMGTNPSSFKGDSLPVENVSWNDAQSFIQKLNAKGDGQYRLPSEAEWEYAARAGSTTAYACGDSEDCLGQMAWYIPNSEQTTHPVGQKSANAWGLYDMHGNVSEWVQDIYEPYAAGAVTDPTGASKGDYRLDRGGAWNHYADRSRSADRDYGDAGGSDNVIGFRLARVKP